MKKKSNTIRVPRSLIFSHLKQYRLMITDANNTWLQYLMPHVQYVAL